MNILGPTRTTLRLAEDWAIDRKAHSRFVNVIPLYIELAPIYGIPAENAIGQAAKETNYGHYTGVVPASFHNWCGLKTKDGSDDIPEHHQAFLSDRAGVEAHLQHLLRYAGGDLPAGRRLIDPRWHLVTKFTDTIEGLGGKGSWAPAPSYGTELAKLIRSIPVEDQAVTLPQIEIPGIEIEWLPADSRHFTKGRTSKIKQIVHHHTDGYDSRAWLTTSPNSNVSAHFLVNHEGTKVWQLVRIEDTAHTQGTHNPWSVGIEWERKWPDQDAIPSMVYETLSRLDMAIIKYVKEHGLGEVKASREGILRHDEVNNTACPQNLDVDMIVGLINLPDDGERHFDEVPFTIRGSIRERWESVGDKSLPIFGLPLSPEYEYVHDGVLGVRQDFERTSMFYDKGAVAPWDVTSLFVSELIADGIGDYNNLKLAAKAHIKESRDSLVLLEKALR